jgi:fibronectin-binding autotransporter adhesin
MATRFWVGGAGNWSSTTKWSTTSGGAGGASVPTSVDDAVFDANSGGKFTATVDTAQSVASLTITPSSGAGLLQIALTAPLTVGNLTTTGTAGNNRIWFRSNTYGININMVVNGTVSISDCDFRGVYVTGTSAPISGTRLGNRGETRGVTFSTPKTVYWNLAGAQSWSANGWAATSGGTPSTDYFPLPQDTAVFDNAGSVTGVISLDNTIGYVSTVDMSARTSAMSISVSNSPTIVYGDWKNGSGTAFVASTATLTFSGGNTQTITSAGKQLSNLFITVDTYGGTVQLADPLNIGTGTLTVTNGTFDTLNQSVSAGVLSSSNSNVRTIKLGASTVSLSASANTITFTTSTNFTFNAGTSNINIAIAASGSTTINLGNLTFYNLSFTNTISAASFSLTINGANTFNNLTIAGGASTFVVAALFGANQTVTGTLTCSGAAANRRVALRSDTVGSQRTLTVGTLVATDCDFRDIAIAGTAAGTAPTRAGDNGDNSGVVFPAPKTVYWNLAGAQNWSANGWAATSGGTPAVNNFPLSQDTAVFDNTGAVTGTISFDASWSVGTFDASSRTSAMTLSFNSFSPLIYGDWKFGTGVTVAATGGGPFFSKFGTQTITSNGVTFNCGVSVFNSAATVQLADALQIASANTLSLLNGTFDAVTYNVTAGLFSNTSSSNTLRMGTGTWTLTGTGTVWGCATAPTLVAGTSTIALTDTSTTARTFAGGGLYYNKLTIGGATGTSTLTISGANTFGEIASTKTVAHTIVLPSSTTTNIGKWSVTGTVGNVVTLAPSTAATPYTLSFNGPAASGIDYLSISYCTVSTTSPGEFYVGANSTNTAGNTGSIIFTAAPTPRTLYWVGGTGNWSATTSWSTTPGVVSATAIPTSLDAVVFNNLSNATAYTATIDAGVTIARCASFNMAGPASGNVTFAGTVPIAFHGSVLFAATGITRTYSGVIYWAGNSSYTFTTNGLSLASQCLLTGIGATWTLGSSLTTSGALTITYGGFNTSASNYAVSLTTNAFSSNNSNVRSVALNASTITYGSATAFGVTPTTNLTFNADTSTINITNNANLTTAGVTFYNVNYTSTTVSAVIIQGANTFNTLSFPGAGGAGIASFTFNANQTIGTLTLTASSAAANRTFLASNLLGTTRTLTVGTVTAGAADIDFRDIVVAGVAAPLTGTRFGDCGGNSGITFPAAKTVYWALSGSGNWGTTGAGSWSATSGGAAAADQFPLAQDTAVFPATLPSSGSTVTVNANYNIGTIDMSARTSNTMVLLASSAILPTVYGNWTNGTGVTMSGSGGTITFAGRGSQVITSAGVQFTKALSITTPGGTVTLADALSINTPTNGFTLSAGSFDAVTYNVTLAGTSTMQASSGTGAMVLGVGSGTWTVAADSAAAWNTSYANLTITGTGTISFTGSVAKQLTGGNKSYANITINQGGAGSLTITGNNTFKTITNTYGATSASTIVLGNTTQTFTSPWAASGTAGKLLTLNGSSATLPATLIYTGAGLAANVDYLNINNVRAYDVFNEWYAGTNSTNGGSSGWYFSVGGSGTVYTGTVSETASAADAVAALASFLASLSETATGTDTVSAAGVLNTSIAETASATDALSAVLSVLVQVSETATGTDAVSALSTINVSLSDAATAADVISAAFSFDSAVSEAASAADQTASVIAILRSVAESASASDTLSTALSALVQVSETATGTDAVTVSATLSPSVDETATATDNVTTTFSFGAVVLESATGTDTPAGSLVVSRSVSETATATDAPSTVVVFVGAISETVTAADLVSALPQFLAQVSETATATDITLVAPSTFSAVVQEALASSDLVSSRGTLNVRFVDSATALDSVVGAFLWNLIDDSQTPNWTLINSSHDPNWQGLDDSQNPNWQNISNI